MEETDVLLTCDIIEDFGVNFGKLALKNIHVRRHDTPAPSRNAHELFGHAV